MATKPDYDLSWAVDASALKSEPTTQHKRYGWGLVDGIGEKPNLNEVNYWRFSVYKWMEYLQNAESERDTQLADLNFKIDNVQAGPTCDVNGQNCVGGVSYTYSNEDSANLSTYDLTTFFNKDGTASSSVVANGDPLFTDININTVSNDMENEVLEDTYTGVNRTSQIYKYVLNREASYSKSKRFKGNQTGTSFDNRWKWRITNTLTSTEIEIAKYNKSKGEFDSFFGVWTQTINEYVDWQTSSMKGDYLVVGGLRYKASGINRTAMGYLFVVVNIKTGFTKEFLESGETTVQWPNLVSGPYTGYPLSVDFVFTGFAYLDCQALLEETEDGRVFMGLTFSQFANNKTRMVSTLYRVYLGTAFGGAEDRIECERIDSQIFDEAGGNCFLDRHNLDNERDGSISATTLPGLAMHIDDNKLFLTTFFLTFQGNKDVFNLAQAINNTVSYDVSDPLVPIVPNILPKKNCTFTGDVFSDTQTMYFISAMGLGTVVSSGPANNMKFVFTLTLPYNYSTNYTPSFTLGKNLFAYSANLEGTAAGQLLIATTVVPDFDLNATHETTLGISDLVLKEANGQQETYYFGYFQAANDPADVDLWTGGDVSLGDALNDGWLSGELTIDYSDSSVAFDPSKVIKFSDVAGLQALPQDESGIPWIETSVNINEGTVDMCTSVGYGEYFTEEEQAAEQAYILNIERYKSGEFIYAYSNTEALPSGIVRTSFYNEDPAGADSFYNSTVYPDFKVHYADPTGSELDGAPDDLSAYSIQGSPTNTPNDNSVVGSYSGLIVSKWYDKEIYPTDTTVTFQKVTFRMYDAFVAGINYVQDALDDLYRQLNVISSFEAFGGSTVSTDFNNAVSALVNPRRHEETGVSLTAGVPYVVTHNLDQNLVQVAVYDEGDWEEVPVDVEISNSNNLTITSASSATVSLVVLR